MTTSDIPGTSLVALVGHAQERLDQWHRLDAAAQRLAAADPDNRDRLATILAGMIDELEGLERYWVFPGLVTLTRLRDHLSAGEHEWLAQIVTRAVHRLSEYGESGALFDLGVGLAEQDPNNRLGSRHFVTLLLVDDTPTEIPRSLAGELRRLELGSNDDLIVGLLVVTNVEDAKRAVAANDEIQACILRHDLRLTEGGPTVAGSGHRCGQWMRRVRPHIDLYLLTDESVDTFRADHTDFDRTFYRMNEEAELRHTVLAGVRRRVETPFFDALRRYAAAPVGQFHALPVARGASIFNSRWLQDMGEFYGRNIFLAETSSTSGGLDSLLDPHGTLERTLDKAARTWGSQKTLFVTNGTSTANKIVVQALTEPGDIVLIDRNCHKSHHYGLMLSGAHPLYLDAYPVEDYAIYGAVPLKTIKRTLLVRTGSTRSECCC